MDHYLFIRSHSIQYQKDQCELVQTYVEENRTVLIALQEAQCIVNVNVVFLVDSCKDIVDLVSFFLMLLSCSTSINSEMQCYSTFHMSQIGVVQNPFLAKKECQKLQQERINLTLALVKLSKSNFHIRRTTWRQLTSVTWILSLSQNNKFDLVGLKFVHACVDC